mgnify:CR=1 FL=1
MPEFNFFIMALDLSDMGGTEDEVVDTLEDSTKIPFTVSERNALMESLLPRIRKIVSRQFAPQVSMSWHELQDAAFDVFLDVLCYADKRKISPGGREAFVLTTTILRLRGYIRRFFIKGPGFQKSQVSLGQKFSKDEDDLTWEEIVASIQDTAEESLIGMGCFEVLQRGLDALVEKNERWARIVRLYYFEGFSPAQIGEEYKIAASSATRLRKKALRFLLKFFREQAPVYVPKSAEAPVCLPRSALSEEGVLTLPDGKEAICIGIYRSNNPYKVVYPEALKTFIDDNNISPVNVRVKGIPMAFFYPREKVDRYFSFPEVGNNGVAILPSGIEGVCLSVYGKYLGLSATTLKRWVNFPQLGLQGRTVKKNGQWGGLVSLYDRRKVDEVVTRKRRFGVIRF